MEFLLVKDELEQDIWFIKRGEKEKKILKLLKEFSLSEDFYNFYTYLNENGYSDFEGFLFEDEDEILEYYEGKFYDINETKEINFYGKYDDEIDEEDSINDILGVDDDEIKTYDDIDSLL